MEDLTKTWSNLSLNKREGSDFTLHNNHRSSEFIIVAKFLTRRVLNMESVSRTFRQFWRSTSGFKIQNLDVHIVLFAFSNPGDVTRIIHNHGVSISISLCWRNMILTSHYVIFNS